MAGDGETKDGEKTAPTVVRITRTQVVLNKFNGVKRSLDHADKTIGHRDDLSDNEVKLWTSTLSKYEHQLDSHMIELASTTLDSYD